MEKLLDAGAQASSSTSPATRSTSPTRGGAGVRAGARTSAPGGGARWPEVGPTGAAVLDVCERWPDLRLVLAHWAFSDLGRLHRHVTDVPNLFFDTSWWTPATADGALPPRPTGRVLAASDLPYSTPVSNLMATGRCALQAGLTPDQVASVLGGQATRILNGAEPLDLGPRRPRRPAGVTIPGGRIHQPPGPPWRRCSAGSTPGCPRRRSPTPVTCPATTRTRGSWRRTAAPARPLRGAPRPAAAPQRLHARVGPGGRRGGRGPYAAAPVP